MQNLKKGAVVTVTLLSLITSANAITDNVATNGGYNDTQQSQNKAKIDPLKLAQKDLANYETELKEIFELLNISKAQQQEYLTTLKKFSGYVDNYIAEKGDCLIEEDRITINPSPFSDIHAEDLADVEKCYAEAERSLIIYGDIEETMNQTYIQMVKLRDRAQRKGYRVKKINKSMATLKSAIDFLQSQKKEG
jgi:hypothetical protein